MSTPTLPNRTPNRLLTLVGAALLMLGVFGQTQEADARLNPFYVVKGVSYASVQPRILFVLDNSGSMAMDVTYEPDALYPNTKCWWDNCENADAGELQSRIHAARDVIKELYLANKDSAEFALMTFGVAAPPDGTNKNEVPEPCTANSNGNGLVKNQDYRFTWVENVNQPYSSIWKPASNAFGDQGIWLLCGDNRPFPYLRHDDLGFSLPNHSDGDLPDQPLYVTHSDSGTFQDGANRSRQVQWFNRFLGRRVNLDCNDEYQAAIVGSSFGDYGENDADRSTEVCDHDFYYWPYVDGYPGYSFYSGLSEDDMDHQECTDNSNCKTEDDQVHRLGVMRRDQWVGASLFAPFYSKSVLDAPGIDWADKGPRDTHDQQLMFDGIVDKSYAGGADVTGGTPMAVAMGVTEYLVHTDNDGNLLGPKPALPMSNAAFAQPTIASYLAFMRVVEEDQFCRPITMIIVSDGQPDPWNKQGGAKLYERLRSVRRLLGVKTYLVAFTEEVFADPVNLERVHEIACAAAGADSVPTPCDGGNEFANWDTCYDPENPKTGCAWLTSNQEELKETLTTIISKALEIDVPGGTPQVANDFQLADPNDAESAQAAVQTNINSWTEVPAWLGHVARGACTDEDPDNPGNLAEYCANVDDTPIDTEEVESFGPCPLGRVWDAGECLRLTAWNERRIYSHDANNNVFRIADDQGEPTAQFISVVNELDGAGLIEPALADDGDTRSNEIAAMAQWLLGKDMTEDWKLPGLPNSAPVLIRRVPQYDANFLPTVGIRDPHCAGRRNALGDNIPPTLEAFSSQAWALSAGGGLESHYNYTEAVLFGDDNGMLHAVHYDSGNELFGFVPRAVLNNARMLSVMGPERMGQSENLNEHVFGVASTVNTGWAFDESAGQWRHLVTFGLGPGGSEIMTVDVSHMGRLQTDDPIEVVWTSSTTSIADDYAETLGQTWSRPALTYAVPNDAMSVEPKAYMVFGSGYRDGSGPVERGRTVWVVDAITGESVTERAFMPVPEPSTIYDIEDDFAAIGDIAVGSHCLSRYWGEMQEAYWADPAGRLFRWDLQTATNDPTTFLHQSDSGAQWQTNGDGFAVAQEAFRFSACQGEGDFTCSVGAIGGGGKGDVFTFSPAVVANNRMDPPNDNGAVLGLGDRDQFMLALASGSPSDMALDGGNDSNDFHSSLYLLVDDHRGDQQNAGLGVPANGAITLPGDSSTYMRIPLSSLERTRTIYYPNGEVEDETRNFSKRARPLKAPSIHVTGLSDGSTQVGSVYYINFTIYEPGNQGCDSRWRDEDTGEWSADPGATYEIGFRLIVENDEPFDFGTSYTLPEDYADGFGTAGALGSPTVQQAGCEGENCGAVLEAPSMSPCDPNVDPPAVGGAISVQTGVGELQGFTPLEVAL